MPTPTKAAVIDQAREWYQRSTGVLFADYRGLKVKEIQKLRGDLRAKGGELHIVKNTLFRLAAGDDAQRMPDELHNGPTAIAFVFTNESECAKTLLDFATSSKKLAVKGGFFNGKALDAHQVEALSKLPSREVLISQVIGAIAAPLSGLVGTIEALYADPIRVIGAVADQKAEGAPAPAPAASAEPAPEATPEATPEVTPEAPAEATEEAAPATTDETA